LLEVRLGNVYTGNMATNDNSVNIESAKRGYHHGDLRSALLATGMRLLEASDAEHLSLREIARETGVSATAVYRHFPDKSVLLSALAAEGMAKLGQEQADAGKIGGAEGFAASGRAYVHFALANPALFRLIFSYMPSDVGIDHRAPEGSAGWMLQKGVAEVMGPAATSDNQFVGMLRAWSLVHGLSMLILDKQIDQATGVSLIDHVVSADSINLG
jgi:AcrR family transcriptional regulator